MKNAIRSPIKTHGGKSYVKRFIIENMPPDYQLMTFVDGCVGGGSIILNKEKSKTEVINDLDPSITELFYYLKYHSKEFIDLVNPIQYNVESLRKALEPFSSGIQAAVNEMVARRMSRGGLKTTFSWSERKRGNRPGDENSWITFKENHLSRICERLKDVVILNENVIDVVTKYNSPEVFAYLDPPYVPSTRTATKVYEYEMAEGDHILLAEVLQNVKSKVMLSGYYSKLYAKMYKDWNMATKEIANHASQSKKKQRRIEVIWCNY